MSTVKFNVPDEVKATFNATLNGRNKSSVIASPMLEAIKREHRKRESQQAINRI
ncbi:MAG: hypothetical protein OXE81_01025 [Gammaproteobacteria bacterium]|nr:hypothetical protein [Gammaproteobacteria bacterium]MCY4276412.1 hypothetical protein [Gammaproteobacteria bacterium]